jgi:purine-binding chemotaxis protein CheW
MSEAMGLFMKGETMTASGLEMTETAGMAAERQIVVLHLADEMYGVDIDAIHTVITPQAITAVPKSPDFVKGVINLRGRVLPVIDLRTRFGLPPLSEERSRNVRIVIVQTAGLHAGLIVDGVSEVLRLPLASIDPPSQLIASAESDCITGIGRIAGDGADERLIILLDVAKTLTGRGLDAARGAVLAEAA